MNSGNPDSPAQQRIEHLPDPIERIILNSMNEGVITLDCDATISTVNPSAVRILGLTGRTVVGQPLEDIFAADGENTRFRQLFKAVIHEGRHTLHEELRYKRPDGQTVDLAVASSFLEFDVCEPGMESVVVVFRDITAFKSIERAVRKAVNHLSHELKTPIAIIKASVELLARSKDHDESAAKNLARIERNLTRLTSIQSIGEQILSPEPCRRGEFALEERAQAILEQIGRESSHRHVSIVSRVQDILTDIIDPDVFESIIKTLVKNAIENTPDEGEVVVSAEQVPDGVLLRVRDSGVGIPMTEQEFIFDGFHHTQETDDYSSKRPYDFNAGGKGLELLLLKVLSEKCSFDISFRSTRCRYIPTSSDHCPGRVSQCPNAKDLDQCRGAGGTVFSVLFHR